MKKKKSYKEKSKRNNIRTKKKAKSKRRVSLALAKRIHGDPTLPPLRLASPSPLPHHFFNGLSLVFLLQYPDGMTIDEDGMLWVAMYNGWKVSRAD